MVKGSPTPQSCTHKLPRKSLPGSWGTFSRSGKACLARGEHFSGREKLAALRRNIFPSRKTLPRCAGTLSRAEKPCRAAQEHFPEWENLAALRGNTFTGMETLLRFAATLLRAWKPCCVLRQAFNDGMLVAVVSVRPHQGVCDTPLQFSANNLHKMA